MKKKGFTLIELLAVIVILAIVALISTPTILGVIQKSKKASSEASAYGYIDAVEKYIMTNSMDMSKPNINNGTYKDNELDVNYKGKGPDNALVTVEKGIVKEAKLCINKYSFDYDGKEVTNSVNNYCSDNYKIKLVIDDNIEEKSIEKNTNTTFEVSDITNKTNIVCNNGAVPTLENNILTISNIFGDTTCKINNTLEDTINNIDNTENNIIMISDETINNVLLTINSNKKLNLNLNGLTIIETTSSDKPFITNNGNLHIYDSVGTGLMKANYRLIKNVNGTLNISSGNYERINSESASGAVLSNEGKLGIVTLDGGIFKGDKTWTMFASKGKIIINNAYIYNSNSYAIVSYYNGEIIINNGTIESEKSGILVGTTTYPNGKLTINGGTINSIETVLYNIKGEVYINSGTFISNTANVIINSNTGIININQTDKPIYMLSKATVNWAPVIKNSGTGKININANNADKCTNSFEDTKKGLCVYANGDGTTTPKGNCGIQNHTGTININGGTYFASHNTINNYSEGGVINIQNGNFLSNNAVFQAQIGGTINICEAKILSSYIDFYINPAGTNQKINYSSNVIFPDGTNTPKVGGITENIFSNYIGTCK